MSEALAVALALAYGYLVGSIPTAYLAGRWVKGIDLRRYGSGSIGGSNVVAHVGKAYFVPVVAFDLLVKGTTTVLLAGALGLGEGLQAMAGLTAVSGHNWSLYLRFSGGRGLSTALGVLTILGWRELVILASLGLIGWSVLRSSGLLFFIGIVILPLASLLFREPSAVTVFTTGFLTLTVARRLTAGGSMSAQGTGWGQVLLNRLLFDRDVADRDAWKHRTPKGRQGEG